MRNKNYIFGTFLSAIVFWSFAYIILMLRIPTQKVSVNVLNRDGITSKHLYSKEHELVRRRLDNTIKELYYFFSDQVERHNNLAEFQFFGKDALDKTLSLMAMSANFSTSIDNAGEWHKSELKKVSSFILRRINKLQNPEDCSKARILICQFAKRGCGLGCMIHRVGYCLNIAAASNRTMILHNDAKKWKYSSKGWNLVYKPLSRCTYANTIGNEKIKFKFWHYAEQKDQITFLRACESCITLKFTYDNFTIYAPFFKAPEQAPSSFPKQIATNLLTHHSNPSAFFGAHFIWYASQNNEQMQLIIDKFVAEIKLNESPTVGIHIRRGDKLDFEGEYFSVEQYFKWAELWFQIQEKQKPTAPKLKRRVYLASDDLNAIEEAKKKYPHYEILFDMKAVNNTGTDVFSEDFLRNVIKNQHVLSMCDYVVCTASSNVCRYIYELMQVRNGDADNQVKSLDTAHLDHYSRLSRNFTVIEDHVASNPSEFNLKVGDVVCLNKFQGNLFNGYSTGSFPCLDQDVIDDMRVIMKRTKNWHELRYVPNEGKYPSYKTQEIWNIVDFPLFTP